jgi:hypothetical protein
LRIKGERGRSLLDSGSSQDLISREATKELGLGEKDRLLGGTELTRKLVDIREQASTVAGKSESVDEYPIDGAEKSISCLISNFLIKGVRATNSFSRIAPSLLLFATPASASPAFAQDCNSNLRSQIGNLVHVRIGGVQTQG